MITTTEFRNAAAAIADGADWEEELSFYSESERAAMIEKRSVESRNAAAIADWEEELSFYPESERAAMIEKRSLMGKKPMIVFNPAAGVVTKRERVTMTPVSPIRNGMRTWRSDLLARSAAVLLEQRQDPLAFRLVGLR